MKQSLHVKIEEIALLFFSEQGFNETSTSEIATKAGVSETSIFRLFKTKHDLYIHVLKEYGENIDLDYNLIYSKITFEDINKDLSIIVDIFFAFYFENIHITRIYISNAIQFHELTGFDFLTFPQLKIFLEKYLFEMGTRGFIDETVAQEITNLIASSILQDVVMLTTFEKIEALDENTRNKLIEKWNKTIPEIGKLFGW